MIYVEIVSQLADQMFLYSFARHLQLNNKSQQKEKIAFDYKNYDIYEEAKYYIHDYKCDENIISKERKLNIIQRLALNIFCRNRDKAAKENKDWEFENKYRDLMSIFGVYICTYNYHEFKHKSLFKNYLLLGFYHGYKFFEDIDDELRKEFKPKSLEFSPYITNLLKQIDNTNSVCMHIRRGDFESSSFKKNLSICHEKYFYDAINIIKEKVENPKIFISTDDMEWAKTLNIDIEHEIINYDEVTSPINLYVMSRCKHFIISNSGYSWWAQHLSDNKDKIVIAPDRWTNLNPEKNTDLYESNWTLVHVD